MEQYSHCPKLELRVQKAPSLNITPNNLKMYWSIETTDSRGKLKKDEGECKSFLRNFANVMYGYMVPAGALPPNTTWRNTYMPRGQGGFNPGPYFNPDPYHGITYTEYFGVNAYTTYHYASWAGFERDSVTPVGSIDSSTISFGYGVSGMYYGTGVFFIDISDTPDSYSYSFQRTFTPLASATLKKLIVGGNKTYVSIPSAMVVGQPNLGSDGFVLAADAIPDFEITAGIPYTVKFTVSWSSSSTACYTKNLALLMRAMLFDFSPNLTDVSGNPQLCTFSPNYTDYVSPGTTISLGTGSSSPKLSDYALGNQVMTVTNPSHTVAVDDGTTKLNWHNYTAFVASSAHTGLQEVGEFLGSGSTAIMIARGVFTPVNLGIGDALGVRLIHEIAL